MTDLTLPNDLNPNKTVEIKKRGRAFKVLLTKNEPFWKEVEGNTWEVETFVVFDRFIAKDVIYLDVGCWIGPTVLYGAQAAKKTYAFEPDPVAYDEMRANLDANSAAGWSSNVKLFKKAIAARSGYLDMGNRGDGGDSTSSALFVNQRTTWGAEAVALQSFIEDENIVAQRIFLKIDIEGGEFELIPSIQSLLAREDVTLYLSVHTHFLAASLIRGSGLFARVRCRTQTWLQHIRLCRSLPFKYFYNSNGTKLNLKLALKTLLFEGSFPRELVGSHRPW
jgi:FkbM family methyltransferase